MLFAPESVVVHVGQLLRDWRFSLGDCRSLRCPMRIDISGSLVNPCQFDNDSRLAWHGKGQHEKRFSTVADIGENEAASNSTTGCEHENGAGCRSPGDGIGTTTLHPVTSRRVVRKFSAPAPRHFTRKRPRSRSGTCRSDESPAAGAGCSRRWPSAGSPHLRCRSLVPD